LAIPQLQSAPQTSVTPTHPQQFFSAEIQQQKQEYQWNKELGSFWL
jgi:hypothetical protein